MIYLRQSTSSDSYMWATNRRCVTWALGIIPPLTATGMMGVKIWLRDIPLLTYPSLYFCLCCSSFFPCHCPPPLPTPVGKVTPTSAEKGGLGTLATLNNWTFIKPGIRHVEPGVDNNRQMGGLGMLAVRAFSPPPPRTPLSIHWAAARGCAWRRVAAYPAEVTVPPAP